MYPLKFKKILKEKVWGGRALEDILGIELPDEKLYGESWEVSSHGKDSSVVENGSLKGKNLQELLESYKEKLVGEKVYKEYGDRFPLLIKYLDINDKLSVQVHPDDAYALKNEKDLGKTEAWYVIWASPNAKLILGLREGISKEDFSRKVKNKDFKELFNEVEVKTGDYISINPGLVHASLEGSILICEPQQNSDTTYRIYDFDRIVDGQKRELHMEKALDVIDFSAKPKISSESIREKIFIDNNTIEKLSMNNYFGVEILKIEDYYKEQNHENFVVYSILEGTGEFLADEITYNVKEGDTWFIPANLSLEIQGQIKILKTYI